MRRDYLSTENIGEVSSELTASVHRKHMDRLDHLPKDTALLVIDMQDYFLDPSSKAFIPSSKVILPKIKELISLCQITGMPIIFTRHVDVEKGGTMDQWWGGMLEKDDPLSNITEELDTSKSDIIEKNHYDAFLNTDLDSLLKEKGIRRVIISGIKTHLCCETTARSAFMHGYEVLFTIDGTSTNTLEQHRATIVNLSHGFATVVLVDEIKEALDAKEPEARTDG